MQTNDQQTATLEDRSPSTSETIPPAVRSDPPTARHENLSPPTIETIPPAAPSDPPTAGPESLSASQLTAIEAILTGRTITAAALAAGVDRKTVHRWVNDDFTFQAELNRGRRELRCAVLGNLEWLAAKAADCLEKAIVDQGDVKAALEILKRMDLFGARSIGSEDAATLAAEAVAEAEAEAIRAAREKKHENDDWDDDDDEEEWRPNPR